MLNLSTVTKDELPTLIVAWGYPNYRADQVWKWIRNQGVTNVDEMSNLPKKLRQQLAEYSKPTSLEVAFEMKSKDGTIKRAYRCQDGQIIEDGTHANLIAKEGDLVTFPAMYYHASEKINDNFRKTIISFNSDFY